MKSFLDHLKEEVLPSVQVADGGLDISKPAVRAAINAAIAGVVSQPAVTPYVVFNRLSKLLAQYHIVLPKRFLEGDKGVEVFEVKQFGHKMGMTDSGEFVNEVPSTHYLFLQYGILSPFGITYAKPVVGGMFKVMARLVDKEELDKLMDMAEITMAEEAEQMQAISKANAPKEGMHTALGDCDCSQGDSPSTKKAVKVSMKKIDEEQIEEGAGPITGSRRLAGSNRRKRKAVQMALGRKHKGEEGWNDRTRLHHSALTMGRKLQKQGVVKEEYEKVEAGVRKRDGETHTLHRRNPGHKTEYHTITTERDGRKTVKTGSPKYIKKHWDKMEEEQIDEISLAKAAKTARLRNVGAERSAHASPYDYSPHIDDQRRKAGKTVDRIGLKHGDDKAKKVSDKMSKDTDKVWRGKMGEDKDPCWKGYEMIGMKKKGGRPVPNCVPVEEEQIDELHGKGSLEKIRSHHQGEANKLSQGGRKQEKRMGALGRLHRDSEDREDAIKHHMGKAKKARGLMSKLAMREETQIDELKRSTLASYIKKAHVSGLGAASQGEIAYANKDKEGLRAANKTGEKREQGIERAASKLAKEETQLDEVKSGQPSFRDDAAKRARRLKTAQQKAPKDPEFWKKVDAANKKRETIAEKAPPGAKFERMVKHIKKGYAEKDGLSKKEKSIAYATAWKAKNREKGE